MKTILAIFLVILTSFSIYYFYLQPAKEKQLLVCINAALKQLKINTIQIEDKNLTEILVLKGSAKKPDKVKFMQLIKNQCQLTAFKDSIKVVATKHIIYPSLNFKVDHFNQIVSINGLVKNQVVLDNILGNFTNVYQNESISEDSNWTIAHDIIINRQVKTRDLDVFIALLLPSIKDIKLTDISITNKQLTVGGLVRDKTVATEIISKLAALFEDDWQIINQLEQVVGDKPKVEKLKIELSPMPKLEEF